MTPSPPSDSTPITQKRNNMTSYPECMHSRGNATAVLCLWYIIMHNYIIIMHLVDISIGMVYTLEADLPLGIMIYSRKHYCFV